MPKENSSAQQPAEGVSIRRAGAMLGGKAPQTVERLLRQGELAAMTIVTEAGHHRTYVRIDSIDAYLARVGDSADKAA